VLSPKQIWREDIFFLFVSIPVIGIEPENKNKVERLR
jgi:hypothetical protein